MRIKFINTNSETKIELASRMLLCNKFSKERNPKKIQLPLVENQELGIEELHKGRYRQCAQNK